MKRRQSFNLDELQVEVLNELAKAQGISRSSALEMILRKFLNDTEQKEDQAWQMKLLTN